MELEPEAVVMDATLVGPDPGGLATLEAGDVLADGLALDDPAILAELVIEEVSIDGMCGVY